jgi:hypothetical protein
MYISIYNTPRSTTSKLIMHNVFGCTPQPHSLQVIEEDSNNSPIVMCKQVVKQMAPLINPFNGKLKLVLPNFWFWKNI